uniref:peptidylprolyl isomerase n=1 Tax=Ciona intestinalis TaxID=7719 RepID=F7A491_CIOIN
MWSLVVETVMFAVYFICVAVLLQTVYATPHFKIEEVFKPEECERPSRYGDEVFVHFVGKSADTGLEFDRSHADKPYRFQLGTGEVIEGFDEGLANMCPGEKRKLTIPPHMAYGHKGGHLPQMPGGTLLFDVEMVHAQEGPRHPKVFDSMDIDGDKKLSKFELRDYLRAKVDEADAKKMTPQEEVDLVNEILAFEDIDKDGFISKHEFSGSKHEEL